MDRTLGNGVNSCRNQISKFWSIQSQHFPGMCFFTLSNYMTRTCFENILNNLTYTNKEPPEYEDRFWEVCNMLDCWNKNMAKMFLPSWMNCIDESMSKWVNEYTFPGFMFVPHKPWSFGNEYHNAGCAESDIIWALELWEGKDQPPQLNNKPFDNIGKTVGTLEKQWGHCYISQNLCGVAAESLFLTVAFVFSRQLLSYKRKVCLQWP